MSFETRVFDLITTLRKDLRDLRTEVGAIQAGGGTGTVSAATETVSGVLELATQTETNTGVDDLRAITPLKFQTRLAAFAQPLSANLTTLAGVVSSTFGRSLLSTTDAASAKTSLSLTKTDVGLANVDNTSDVNKPVSSAQQTALNLKVTTGSLSKTDVGLGNVDNTSDASKPVSTAQQTALNLKADTTALPTKTSLGLSNVDNTSDVNKPVSNAQQTALNLKADTTALPTKASLGLANVDNTSDVNKPVSTAQQTALNLKADTTALPTKASLGLANVDNTSDVNKPVSTAQQTALNLKANLASPSLTGVPIAPTAASGTNTTQVATTEFVTTAVSASVAGTPTNLDGGPP